MVKKVVKEMFSEARIALMKEVRTNHPELVFKLQAAGSTDWGTQLGEIAAHVNVLMDGNYMPDELEALYPQLIQKLRKKGQIVITSDKIH